MNGIGKWLLVSVFALAGVGAWAADGRETIYSVPLDTDPGWSVGGQWQFGTPQGLGGDPNSAHTGNNVYGYNQAGGYADNMPVYYLTSTPFDCRWRKNVRLSFWRWLGVESAIYDHAAVETSHDGTNWVAAWLHRGASINDTAWTRVEYDISAVADHQATVYIRWAMGPSDGGLVYCGWNIDDIELTGEVLDKLKVTPDNDFTVHGYLGGPVTPTNRVYTLSNLGSNVVDWTVAATSAWVTVTPISGTLGVGATSTITVAVTAAANDLPVGMYADTVTFSNVVSGIVQARAVRLAMDPIPGEIAVFDSVAPSDNLSVAFGDVIVGVGRTETVIMTNQSASYPLVLTNLSLRLAPTGSSAPPGAVPCYGIDLTRGKLMSFSSDTAATLTVIGALAGEVCAADFLAGDFTRLYALTRDSNELQTIDTATGAQTTIGSCVPAAGHVWTGLAGSPDGTLYAASTDVGVSMLYRVDTITGHATEFGEIVNAPVIADIAVNADGEIYGVDTMNDVLVWIDPATGAGTVIGALGESVTGAQGLDFDEESGRLYWAALTARRGPEWWTINTTTGAGTKIGALPAQLTMAVAKGGPAFWLPHPSTLPLTLEPGGSVTVEVRYQPPVIHSNRSWLVVGSTDADEPVVQVELSGVGIADSLRVSPATRLVAAGHPGGPFAPATAVYSVTNAGQTSLQWAAIHSQSWVSVTPSGGMLAAGGRVDVTVGFDPLAVGLPAGTNIDWIVFSNITSTVAGPVREVRLVVFTSPSIQVSPGSLTVTNHVGGSVVRVLTVGNASTADAPLDIHVRTYETGGTLESLTAGSGAISVAAADGEPAAPTLLQKASAPSAPGSGRLAVAAAAAAKFRPPKDRDFTRVQPGVKFAPRRLLVRFDPGSSGAERTGMLKTMGGGTVKREYRIVPGLCVVEPPEGTTIETALRTLNGQPGILYAEPEYAVEFCGKVPNDPSFASLWGMQKIRAPQAWSAQTGSRSILVAVIDTGVDYNHVDLSANIWSNPGETGLDSNGVDKATNHIDDDGNGYVDDVHGYDFVNNDGDPMDEEGHGTHCAGTIGAVGNNNVGVAGVCWNVSIMALRFESLAEAIACIEYATLMGARLTSNSWGTSGYMQAMKDAIDAAAAADIALIAASGNLSRDTDILPFYPSGYNSSNVISVVATDGNDGKASFSDWGAVTTDIGAPGVGILSCLPGNGYASWNGTSMATPHVAGAYALLLSANPSLSVAEVKAALLETVDPTLPGLCVSGGRMNLDRAMLRTGSRWLALDPTVTTNIAPGSALNVTASFHAGNLAVGSYTGVIHVSCNAVGTPTVDVPVVMVIADPYETWRLANFTPEQFANVNISGPAADPDQDGLDNEQEYWAGTIPTNPASCLVLYALTNNPVLPGEYVVRWQSATGRLYTVQAATNLVVGFTNLASHIPATPPISVHTDNVGSAGQRFYRVQVE